MRHQLDPPSGLPLGPGDTVFSPHIFFGVHTRTTDGQADQASAWRKDHPVLIVRVIHGVLVGVTGGVYLATRSVTMTIIAALAAVVLAQLTLFETADGGRYSLHVTNLPAATKGRRGQWAYIDAAHRVHARVEDVPHREEHRPRAFPLERLRAEPGVA